MPAEELAALCSGRDALVLGPGLGRFAGDSVWLRRVWEATAGAVPTTAMPAAPASGAPDLAQAIVPASPAPLPLVLDADALNMLADADDFPSWTKRPAFAPVVLTPHPGEMARLLRCTIAEVQRDRIGAARGYAETHGVYLLLKGAGTVIATPQGTVYVNSTGNPGMATGGTGDVLAGIIGSLLAQGWDAERAAAFGVWWHGKAGDRAAEARVTAASLIAGDLIEHL